MPDSLYRNQDRTDLIELKTDVKYLVKEVDKINEKLEHEYVTQDQFDAFKDKMVIPVKMIYGVAGMVLIAFMTLVITFFFNK